MAAPQYGRVQSPGGIEPGFAEMQARFAAQFGGPRDDLDDSERASSSIWSSGVRTRDDEWLHNLLE